MLSKAAGSASTSRPSWTRISTSPARSPATKRTRSSTRRRIGKRERSIRIELASSRLRSRSWSIRRAVRSLCSRSAALSVATGRQAGRRGRWSVVMMPCMTPNGARSSCAARAMNWPFRSERRCVRSWSSAPWSRTPPSAPSARRSSSSSGREHCRRPTRQAGRRAFGPPATSGTAIGERRRTGLGGSAASAGRRSSSADARVGQSSRAIDRGSSSAPSLAVPTGTSSRVCGRKRRHAARRRKAPRRSRERPRATPAECHAAGAALGQQRKARASPAFPSARVRSTLRLRQVRPPSRTVFRLGRG